MEQTTVDLNQSLMNLDRALRVATPQNRQRHGKQCAKRLFDIRRGRVDKQLQRTRLKFPSYAMAIRKANQTAFMKFQHQRPRRHVFELSARASPGPAFGHRSEDT